MDTLKIATSQNIDIEETVASVGERIVATLVDGVFIGVYSITLMIIFNVFKLQWLIYLGLAPVLFYNLISEVTMNGQTFGKKLVKIKVSRINGTPVSFISYFLRWVLGLIEISMFFGSLALITIIINRKGQRLGDVAANTTVIRLKRNQSGRPLLTRIPENYEPVYDEVSKLSIGDIHTLEELLDTLKKNSYDPQLTLIAQKAKSRIETTLGITSTKPNIEFFQTILNDYYYFNYNPGSPAGTVHT